MEFGNRVMLDSRPLSDECHVELTRGHCHSGWSSTMFLHTLQAMQAVFTGCEPMTEQIFCRQDAAFC